jgi:hypothetical protein
MRILQEGRAIMTWIQTIGPENAPQDLGSVYSAIRALYPAEYGGEVAAVRGPDGTVDSITAAHSLIPEAMRHGMSFFAVLLHTDLPLSRAQHEMIATVVSVHNRCFY